MKIVCVGGGYVGGPTMTVFATKCPDVTVHVLDSSESRIEAWNAPPTPDGSAFLPIFEPGLQGMVLQVRNKNLFFTSNPEVLRSADIIFIAVNTPTKLEGMGAGCAADLTYVESCAHLIGDKAEKENVIVVEKSTVPVKCSTVVQRILDIYEKPEVKFTVLSNPEFLAEGTAVQDLLHPDRVLIGGDPDAAAVLSSLYEKWVPKDRIITTHLSSSELSKLVANAFLAQRISSINSISCLCEQTGASITEIQNAIGRDKRIGKHFLNASVGFGGSCFQKDLLNLIYICESQGLKNTADYWRQVILMNNYQKERFYRKVVKMCNGTLRCKKVAVLGFAFKKNTSDTRESAAIYICAKMLVEGANIYIYDPKVTAECIFADLEYFMDTYRLSILSVEKQQKIGVRNALLEYIRSHVTVVRSPMDTVDGASALLILTEWDEFRDLDYSTIYRRMLKPASLLDGRLILDHTKLTRMGFEVFAVGQSIHPCKL